MLSLLSLLPLLLLPLLLSSPTRWKPPGNNHSIIVAFTVAIIVTNQMKTTVTFFLAAVLDCCHLFLCGWSSHLPHSPLLQVEFPIVLPSHIFSGGHFLLAARGVDFVFYWIKIPMTAKSIKFTTAMTLRVTSWFSFGSASSFLRRFSSTTWPGRWWDPNC